jgi:hypothetical protein
MRAVFEAARRRTPGSRARRLTEQVPWDVENREPSAFFRIGIEICLNKKFDGLVAGVDFDADRCIAKIHLVSATIFPRMIA